MLSYKKQQKAPERNAKAALKVLSNEHRYFIMKVLLSSSKDLCVHELAEEIGISQSHASHQLAYLEACGVVESVRDGRAKCYIPTDSPLTQKLRSVIKSLS